jgi:hypothetical protein
MGMASCFNADRPLAGRSTASRNGAGFLRHAAGFGEIALVAAKADEVDQDIGFLINQVDGAAAAEGFAEVVVAGGEIAKFNLVLNTAFADEMEADFARPHLHMVISQGSQPKELVLLSALVVANANHGGVEQPHDNRQQLFSRQAALAQVSIGNLAN